MADVTIRPVDGKEMLRAVYALTSYALRPSPPLPDPEEWEKRVTSRQGVNCLAAYEGENPVACAASSAMTQNVRGAVLGMGGIWDVATHPAARRKGYSRQLLARQLDIMHQSGQALSALYPFRESFYERLGYVTLPQIHKTSFAPSTLSPLLKAFTMTPARPSTCCCSGSLDTSTRLTRSSFGCRPLSSPRPGCRT